MKKNIYFFLAVLGLISPYLLLVAFVRDNGLDAVLFFKQIWVNYVSSMAMVDLLLSSFAFFVFGTLETKKQGMRRFWPYVLLTFGVGLCFSLPLFLWKRELALESKIVE